MNAKQIMISLAIVGGLALTACAPAAAPTRGPIGVAPRESQKSAENRRMPATAAAEPTSAPAAEAERPAPGPIAVAPAEGAASEESGDRGGGRVAPEPTAAPEEKGRREPYPTATPPADNYFQDYGVNPYVDTARDHLSTFALDVDTASYAVARQYVYDGYLPPYESVRAEEFINYFSQDYPKPSNIAFGVYADGAPSPFHRDGSYLVRIGVQGYDVPDRERKPASLTFVIDVSGSMADGGRLEMVKDALSMLVERLRPDDTVAIVVFTSNAWVALNPTSGRDKRAILDAIYSLYPQNSTNADAGLHLGYDVAMEMYRPGDINRIIMCSDGVANTGTTDPDALVEFARSYSDRIMLTTVGVGMGNYNDILLERLADKGNGFYAYVDTPDEAQKLFLERLTGTLQTIARDAKVQVDFNPDVVARYRLIGYENRAIADQDFRNDTVDAGEIGAGHTATAIYALQFRPNAEGRVGTVQLRWQDPDTREVKEINGNFNTWDLAGRFEDATPRYQLAATVAQYAEILRQSPWAGETSLRDLRRYADQVARQLRGDADVQEFADLVARASEFGR